MSVTSRPGRADHGDEERDENIESREVSADVPSLAAPAWKRLSRHRHSIRSVMAIIGGNSASFVLGAVGLLFTARYIGPELTGSFRSYTIPLMYAVFLHLGTFDGLYRQIPFYLGQNREDLVESAASSAGAWNRLLSMMGSGIFLLLATWSIAHGDLRGALGWTSQALVVWWIFYGGYLAATYRTIDHFVAMARIQTLQSILSFALVFILPLLGFIGLCVRAAVPWTVETWLLHRKRPLKVPLKLRRKPLLELIRVGLPYCFWHALYNPMWSAIENTFMLALGGVKGLGLFAVAAMLREAVCILPQAIYQVLTPRVVQAYGRDGRLGSTHRLAYQIVPPLAVGMGVVVVTLAHGLDKLVPMLMPKYADGLRLMKLVLWMGVIQSFTLPLNALIASGKSWSFGRGVLGGLIVFPIVTLLLAPSIGGVLAVAAGSLFGKATRTALGYWELRNLARQEVNQ